MNVPAGQDSAVGAAGELASAGDKLEAPKLDETSCRTLFAFDNVSIPFSQNLRLEMREPEKHPGNPVVQRGEPGTPDSWAVQFYGSVIREGGKFRMWYVAAGDERGEVTGHCSSCWRPAYAESDDGINWTKPELGLVDYHGSSANNLVSIGPHPLGILNLKVLAEPDDPNPAHRYKMTAHAWFSKHERRKHGTLVTFVSTDGLHWNMAMDIEPVDAEIPLESTALPPIHCEPAGGLYKWDGMYYSSGQGGGQTTRPCHGRPVRMYRSRDFVEWSQTSNVGFVRDAQHHLLGPGRSLEGEQTHEGVSVWHRGNVLLGLYGQWHGARDWSDVRIDLGFHVSNDGIYFREPAYEWTFLRRGENGAWDQGGLLQAQGFENVGDKTYIWYGAWDPRTRDPRGGVGLATLPRDRVADLVVEEAGQGDGDYQMPAIRGELITAAVPAAPDTIYRFYLNADGLGADAFLRVELLSQHERPLPQFSGENAAVVCQSGFQTPIVWDGQDAVADLADSFRIKVTFEGQRQTEIRFSALYIQDDCSAANHATE